MDIIIALVIVVVVGGVAYKMFFSKKAAPNESDVAGSTGQGAPNPGSGKPIDAGRFQEK